MTDRGERVITEPAEVGPARLEPDAIGAAQDTVIAMANAAPTVSVGLTLAALAAYAVGPVILLTAIPMIIIANAYRRLNLWNANCGASFEWVGRAINPYLGFMTGWLMIAGSLVGAISGVVVLTAFAAITYYRRRVFSNVWDALFVGILPLGAAGFLVWIIYRSLQSAPASEVWSVIGIVAAGLILMIAARFVLRSPFFQIGRESAGGAGWPQDSSSPPAFAASLAAARPSLTPR